MTPKKLPLLTTSILTVIGLGAGMLVHHGESPPAPTALHFSVAAAEDYDVAARALTTAETVAIHRDLHISAASYLAAAATSASAIAVVNDLSANGVVVRGSRVEGRVLSITVGSQADVAAVDNTGAVAVVGAELPADSATEQPTVVVLRPSTGASVRLSCIQR